MSYTGPEVAAAKPGIAESVLGFWTPRRLAFPVFLILSVYVVMFGYSAGLADPDYYWHLKTGELIWQAKALPEGDPFSWTFEGRPWVLHEWLFQVGLYRLHQFTGPAGVAIATALLLAVAWFIAFVTADRMVKRPALMFVLALIFGAGMISAGAPRPQMISLVFFGLLLAVFAQAKYAGRHWPLLLVPVLMVIWVNAHGAFVLGIVAMFALAGLEWINLIWRYRDKPQVKLCIWLTVVAGLTLAASLLNPDGIEHWKYPFYVAGLELTAAIAEWKSIMTIPWRGPWYAIGGVVWLVVTQTSRRRYDATELLFPMALFLAGMVQARHAPFASMAMIVFAGPALYNELRAAPVIRSGPLMALGWVVALAGLLVPGAFVKGPYVKAIEQVMPSDVTAFIETADLKGRMLNDYDIGGFLIERLYPERKVFIDGRADLYGDAFYQHYAETVGGRVPPDRHFDTWEIDYVILRHRTALKHMLIMRGDFRLIFEGRTHAILVRENGVNAEALTNYPLIQ